MRILQVGLLAVLCAFCTCSTAARTWPSPVVSSEFQKKNLCIEEIRFYTDEKFLEPAPETDLTNFAKQESRVGLEKCLKEAGFLVQGCSWANRSQLHLTVDAGLHNAFPQFFIVARVQLYDQPALDARSKPICEFLVEAEIRSDREKEVRKTGNLLALKIAKELTNALRPSE